MTESEPADRRSELKAFLFLTVVMAPVLAGIVVASYGFAVWIYQMFAGPPHRMSEIHIASCVAFVRPEALEAVARAIASSGLAEVPQRDPRGRLVILIEARSAARVLDAMDAIRALDGVLAVHLAYQHAEPESAMQEAP